MLTEAKFWENYCNTFKNIAKSIAILLLKKYWYCNTFIDKVLVLELR